MRARLSTWPHERDVAHLVLLDHHMIPSVADVRRWIQQATLDGARAIRTGALFPESTAAFEEVGFFPIDRLVLLRSALSNSDTPARKRLPVASSTRLFTGLSESSGGLRVRRLRTNDLGRAAKIDRRAFTDPWTNDRQSLSEICTATPHHRSRFVAEADQMLAFAISGRTSSTGYVQRLAVDPGARRRGLARSLVVDALEWMKRRGVKTVMVNTAARNDAAIALYTSLGFTLRSEQLTLLEYSIRGRS